uniref:Telomerase Cajal body protein 1 n=1 Tax=Dunaliella tertiolecta TaxID=3047 RepID=A0A7S3VJI3_DUNTE
MGSNSWDSCVPPWSRDQCDSLGVGLRVQEGETIYDFCWFPQMTATDPTSCCFASSSRAHPVHLWDACTGELRATYRGYNEVDEVAAAYSLAFTPDGAQLYAGYDKRILVFDVTRPGRDYGTITCSGGPRKGEAKLPGIISCMAFPPDSSSLAAGTYAGYVGTFDPRSPPHAQLQLLLHGHRGGLTQVSYTRDGQYLVTGARQDDAVLVWDLRYADQALYRLERDTKSTNQRISFSIEPCGRHLLTGGCSGAVRVFDLQTGNQVDELVIAEGDTVNGCDTHPFLSLLAVSTGINNLMFCCWLLLHPTSVLVVLDLHWTRD